MRGHHIARKLGLLGSYTHSPVREASVVGRTLRSEQLHRWFRSHESIARIGLDPIRWTSFQRGIRCPNRWPTLPSDDPVGSSRMNSKPAPCAWFSTKARRSAAARSGPDGNSVARMGATRPGGSEPGPHRADARRARGARPTAEGGARATDRARDSKKRVSGSDQPDLWARNSVSYAHRPEAVAVRFLVTS